VNLKSLMPAGISSSPSLPTVLLSPAPSPARPPPMTAQPLPKSSTKAYLTFFLPFWWEHVLERGRLKPDDVDKTVKEAKGANVT
jgi:hypothetical protein